ncbi:hypothetical protein D7V88_03045 [Corallococcus terminator]|uniref:Bacterial Ig-like domain-containing protein n=2 Tax=Corallococcus terminator TaxID=2316733 RepID=A0A3A8JC81_9BACT|nr:hypothetical protein D7V88_03045 [Corallococcus terminator]
MALTTLLVACGEVMVSLTTDATEYQPGDTVELVLQNQGTREVGYNLCVVRIEHQEESGWIHTPHLSVGEACQLPSYTLKAGAEAHDTLRLPAALPAGEYRIVHDVDTLRTDSEGRSEREPVISNTFLVSEEGTP